MSENNSIRNSILMAILVSVIMTYFITPILNSALPATLALFSSIFGKLSDTLYRHAAIGPNLFYAIPILSAVLTAILIFTFVGYRLYFKENFKTINNLSTLRTIYSSDKILLILTTTIFITSIYYMFDLTVNLKLNTSFQQKMTILAPYMSDLEEEHLRGKWASMKNRGDYRIICDTIDQCAHKNDIKLPRSSR